MIKVYFLFAGLVVTGLILGCGQQQEKATGQVSGQDKLPVPTDSIDLVQAFEKLKTDKGFLKELGLEAEKQFSWNNDRYGILRGDLDGDNTADALLGFSIEGRGGGNNADMHYAVFLHKEGQWQYSGQLDASVFAEDRFYAPEKIVDHIIKGSWRNTKGEDLAAYEADFVLENGALINSFTALHSGDNAPTAYLRANGILMPDNRVVPVSGKLEKYEQLLGGGEMIRPGEQADCGTYFEEEAVRYLIYPQFRFELNDKNEAVLVQLEFKEGFRLQTDKGTISQETTLEELKALFYQIDNWMLLDDENGDKIMAIPDGEASDNQWRLRFNKKGQLLGLSLFIPC